MWYLVYSSVTVYITSFAIIPRGLELFEVKGLKQEYKVAVDDKIWMLLCDEFWIGRSVIQPRKLQNLDKEMKGKQIKIHKANKQTNKNPTQVYLNQIPNFISGFNVKKSTL